MDDSEQNRMATMPTCTSCLFPESCNCGAMSIMLSYPLQPHMQSLSAQGHCLKAGYPLCLCTFSYHLPRFRKRSHAHLCLPWPLLHFLLPLLYISLSSPSPQRLSLDGHAPSPSLVPQHVSPFYRFFYEPSLLARVLRANTHTCTREDAPSLGFA